MAFAPRRSGKKLGAKMDPRFYFRKVWSDDDVLELRTEVCDGRSLFSCNVYVPTSWPQDTAKALTGFRPQLRGGIYDLKAGSFGVEYANGAVLARLQFRLPGLLDIYAHLESEFMEYKGSRVASEAKLYLRSEPVLLDRFIEELYAVAEGVREDATLACLVLSA
jgi:hypothetical protein